MRRSASNGRFSCQPESSPWNDAIGVYDLIRLDHRLQNGAFAGARAAGDDGQAVLEHHFHTLVLHRGEGDAQLPPDLFHHRAQHDGLRLLPQHFRYLASGLALLGEHMGQIDVALLGHDHVGLDHRKQLLRQLGPL